MFYSESAKKLNKRQRNTLYQYIRMFARANKNVHLAYKNRGRISGYLVALVDIGILNTSDKSNLYRAFCHYEALLGTFKHLGVKQ